MVDYNSPQISMLHVEITIQAPLAQMDRASPS